MPAPDLATVKRAYYADAIDRFIDRDAQAILGALTEHSEFAVELSQANSWLQQIAALQDCLAPYRDRGKVYFEYAVPRLGKRIDVIAVIDHVVFVLEFKVGEREFTRTAHDQVWDYALDLNNFHESCHGAPVAPVLIATSSRAPYCVITAASTATTC